jgi:hypothetical protein
MIRTSTRIVRWTQRHELALLNHAQQFGLRFWLIVPISSKKIVPLLAISKAPLRDATALP